MTASAGCRTTYNDKFTRHMYAASGIAAGQEMNISLKSRYTIKV
jgi:hypothetical protein